MERYLSIAWDSGAAPVIVLTKSDLCDNIEQKLSEIESVAIGVDAIVTSCADEDGCLGVVSYIKEGHAIAFIGSSGVGKSTLINRLIGENRLETKGLRNDDKGRHTTTRRELIVLAQGGMVIDTPGKHVISSTYLGDDVYGNPQYSNVRSELGELLFLFKYRNRYEILKSINELVNPFLAQWQAAHSVSAVIPVPSSTPNRMYQPALEIAREVAAFLGTYCFDDVLQKNTTQKSKDLVGEQKQQIAGSIIQTAFAKNEHNTLLVDDLYSSGATLTECVNVLRCDKNIDKIYVLTMTKTKG